MWSAWGRVPVPQPWGASPHPWPARVFSYGRQVVLQRHRVAAAGLALTRKQLG